MNVTATTVSLSVADVPAASRFFATHLGFRELVVAEGIVCLCRDDAAADIVLLPRRDEPPSPEKPAEVIVSFTVSGIAAEQERLRREGATITEPLRLEPWGEWVLRLTDPNGVVIQLVEWQPPAGA
ncbi:VOC family protein [Thermoactinospora rubra]|uniref:VOC family protein n=1 Tax=Thermoactinospora rubra TaxID=1088767 RepID=UPI000A10443D|nr:VOC family protein [Thermoactinospora rubra]